MPEHDLVPRRYSEKEVGRILRRATEIQRSEPSARTPAGLTIGELEDVAREAGIDPSYLRRAAAELEVGGESPAWKLLAGSPPGFVLERIVEGELEESDLEALVPIMQSATIGQGNASSVGKTLTWSSRSDSNSSSQQVLVSSRDGETLIRVEERLTGFAGGIFGGIVGGVGGGVGIGVGGALGGALGSVALAFVFPAIVISSSYMLARGIFTAHVQKRRRRMQELLDRLAERVEADVKRPVLPRQLEPRSDR